MIQMTARAKTEKRHAILSHLKHEAGQLMINGHPVSRVAEVVGHTPFYAYDKQLIFNRLNELRSHFPDALRIHYAIKANPMPELVHSLAPVVDGFDLASHREMLTALSTCLPAEKISIAGPGKSTTELAAAVAAGIVINVESKAEMQRLVTHCQHSGLKATVALRINPSFNVRGSGMVMGGSATQFGIDVDQLAEVIALASDQVNIVGLHIYSGSQNLNHESLCAIFDATFELAAQVITEHQLQLHHVNIGGGLGVPYFIDDQPLDLRVLGDHLEHLLDDWHSRFADTEVIMELGRFLVAEAGHYICQVIEKKQSKGETFVVTNGGLHHHLAATGNFGQVIRRNYPISVANKMNQPASKPVHVVGPLCTPLDTLGKKVVLPEVEVGDLIAVHLSGAYGLSASPGGFLSHPEAGEVLL